ncbi:hypothetical protein [Comamonas sp. JC664]|uniref:hypothetical protein n=1 Tax=Comamonas sp. JC664 TaxID=2801917 RepID=UPI003672B614
MLTLNADGHEIMGKINKNELNPDTKKPLPWTSKTSGGDPIELADVDQWLEGSIKDAQALLKFATGGSVRGRAA